MKAFYLSFLLLLSCNDNASIDKNAVGFRIQNIKTPISHLNEIKWLVGKRKEETVTQSVTFLVTMPDMDQDELERMTRERNVDAWILRVIQFGSRRQDLGSLYTLFRPRQLSRTSGGAASSVSIKIFYAAAYASERFRMFKCPAFSHNRRITDMSVKGENTPFEMTLGGPRPYEEKSQLVELAPSSFNGGNTLVADYYIEMAPYNSVKKQIYGPFIRLPEYVSITTEEQQEVKSCAGVHPEIQY